MDFKLPTALDMPSLKLAIVEEASEHGPFGLSGVGEPPCIPTGNSNRQCRLRGDRGPSEHVAPNAGASPVGKAREPITIGDLFNEPSENSFANIRLGMVRS